MDRSKKHLRLGKRIRAGFTRLTFVIIAMMLISIVSNIILVSYARGIYDGPYQRMVVVDKIELELENMQRNIYTGIAEDDPALIKKSVDQIGPNIEALNKYTEQLKKMASPEEAVDVNIFQQKVNSTNKMMVEIRNHLLKFNVDNSNEYVEASAIMRNDAIPVFKSASTTLATLKKQSEKAASDYLSNAVYAQISVITLMGLSLLISIIISARISKRLEKEITGPVEELVEVSTRISRGDINAEINYDKDDELGILAESMRGIIASLRDLISESNSLSFSAVEGDLNSRGDADKFQGGYREVIQGVNNTLDALIEPLRQSADYMQQISKGMIPERITGDAKGDYNEIKDSINTCIDAVNRLVDDTDELVTAAVHGRLNQRADSSLHGGDFARIIDGVNKTINTLVGHIDSLPSPVKIINKNFEIQYINHSGAAMVDKNPAELVGMKCNELFRTDDCGTEKCSCMQAMAQNTMVTRNNVAHLDGGDQEIFYTGLPLTDENGEVTGALEIMVDQTDLKNAARQAEKNVITAEKQADFQKQEVYKLIANLEKLAKGDLDITTSEQETDEDTKLIGENFAKINTYLNNCISAIQSLIDDAAQMTTASIEGRLDFRADTGKHGGSFAMIIEGLNDTMNAVVKPIGQALTVLQAMEHGNLHTQMDGDYEGDYAIIKKTMNQTIRNIQSYMDEISSVLTEIATGNLNLAITADYKGDFVAIKDSLNNIIVTLSQVLGDINVAAEQVSSGSRQVSDGSQALSQGSTLQASSIEELTASISEIAAQTKKNAVNANQAHVLANHVKDNAEQGDVQMKDMLNSMDNINESSANISKIIRVIDDIAFQTNILALNAAVEAARAGQHGKGFAVVAEEVRNLAARSAAAARETTDLIEGSISKVQIGTKIANETAAALNEIVTGIERAADLVGEIASASNEQATAIAHVNQGIEQVAQVVQNNSATAEESAAASEELSGQAELLKEMVGRFQLNTGTKVLEAPTHRLLQEYQQDKKAAGQLEEEKTKIEISMDEFDKY
jgi:methyl-accepting chemotaxis protein